MIRNYKIIWEGNDRQKMDVQTLLINKPNQPIRIKLKDREI